MKRDWRLQHLSSEHHRALVIARSAIAAAELSDPKQLAAAWEQASTALQGELAPHFQVEETRLLPALDAVGEGALVARTLRDHAGLHAGLASGVEPSGPRLRAWGRLLRDHVRFEEAELFPAAEQRLPESVLALLADPSRAPVH